MGQHLAEQLMGQHIAEQLMGQHLAEQLMGQHLTEQLKAPDTSASPSVGGFTFLSPASYVFSGMCLLVKQGVLSLVFQWVRPPFLNC
jgi:hypothetical protein